MRRHRILFVCGKNKWRSPTAERIYQNDNRVAVRSAGLSPTSKRTVQRKDLEWADVVLVMERKHASRLRQKFAFQEMPKVHCLHIPDDYEFMDETLIEKLRQGTETYLKRLS
ncbi:protein-tyrosine-phosphatase [Kiritimatiellota bacterium B12222]|nr:protein-tyrosine-phosphatase [Kiritimatiellota bacterium B12222]